MTDERPDHDGAYKKLFSSPKMVRSLIEGFVDEELAAELRFDSMTPINVEFRSQALQKRQSDTIWKIPSAHDQDVYVLFLLEFQSSVDQKMALRVMLYVSLLYESILDADPSAARLPPVLPVVLYNGVGSWTAKRSVRDMIRDDHDASLRDYQPDMRYYLIDVGALDLSALDAPGGPVALLFELEKVAAPEDLAALIGKMREVIEANPELEELYVIWFKYVLKPRTNIQLTHEQVQQLTRDEGMLSETIRGWYEEATEAGHAKGLARGREEGRVEAARLALPMLLEATFGADTGRAERLVGLSSSQVVLVFERLTRGDGGDDEGALFAFGEE